MTLLSWMVVLVPVAAEDIMLLLILGVFYFYICLSGIFQRPPVILALINMFGSLNNSTKIDLRYHNVKVVLLLVLVSIIYVDTSHT